MIDNTTLCECARHQHIRGVEMVQIRGPEQCVRIRIEPPRDAISPRSTAPAVAQSPSVPYLAVRCETLGIVRLTHPSYLSVPVEEGAEVEPGQTLAVVEMGDRLTPVKAEERGRMVAILATEGQRVDYGLPLFHLLPLGSKA